MFLGPCLGNCSQVMFLYCQVEDQDCRMETEMECETVEKEACTTMSEPVCSPTSETVSRLLTTGN